MTYFSLYKLFIKLDYIVILVLVVDIVKHVIMVDSHF